MLAAPHRLCFAAASLLWALASLAWALHLTGVIALPDPARHLLPLVHAQVFGLGPMPLFIAGFLFTAGPRWLQAPAVPARLLWPGVGLIVGGWLAVIASAAAGPRGQAIGLGLCTVGWVLLLHRLWQLRARAGTAESFHYTWAATSCTVLTLCLGVSAFAAALALPALARSVALAGLWWGVVVVFVVASDRLLPFLGHGLAAVIERRWPRAGLWLMLSGCGVAGAAAALPAGAWQGAEDLLGLHAAALAGASAWLLGYWRRQPATRTVLLAMLLRAFGWWTLAWAGMALAHARGLDPSWRAAIASAALHALTMGFLGGTMLAMVTRVTVTQAGQAVAIDRRARALEALLQLAVAARVLAALWPVAAPAGLAVAAAAWAGVAWWWTARHARALAGRPARAVARMRRSDGP